jgi:hypothetical protein
MSPYGPEILDIEISTGNCSGACPWCYKSNTKGQGVNMSLETFKIILAKMPKTLTQVALGLTDVNANPDLVPILRHCRAQGIIPNFTLTGYGLTEELAQECVGLVGAVAVSAYPHTRELCYDTIATFTRLGLEQTNMHLLYHADNIPFIYEVLDDVQYDPRLTDLNAVVLLGLKPKGRAYLAWPMLNEDFDLLISWCFDHELRIGFDSCSAAKFQSWVNRSDLSDSRKSELLQSCEPCESALFSWYIDVHGRAWPCSFMEDEYFEAIDMLEVEDFLDDAWFAPQTEEFRERLLSNCRKCIAFAID